MLLRFIERLRERPKEVRNQYAFAIAGTITVVITLVWIVSLPSHFKGVEIADTTRQGGAFKEFFSEMKQNATVIFSSLSNATSTEEILPVATSTERATVTLPILTEDDIEKAQQQKQEEPKPEPRRVLISTTSKSVASTSQNQSPE